MGSNRGLELLAVRVGVQAQPVAYDGGECRKRLWRGPVGVFIGIELDQLCELGLLAGDVGGQAVDGFAPETAHQPWAGSPTCGRMPFLSACAEQTGILQALCL